MTATNVYVTFNTSFKNKHYFLTAVCCNNIADKSTEEEAYDNIINTHTSSTNVRIMYIEPNSFQCNVVDKDNTSSEYPGGIKYLAIGEK